MQAFDRQTYGRTDGQTMSIEDRAYASQSHGKKRLQAYEHIFKIFGFLSELTSLSNEKNEEKAKNLVSSYPDDMEDILAAELIQFAAF